MVPNNRDATSIWLKILKILREVEIEVRSTEPRSEATRLSRGVRGHAPPGNFFSERLQIMQSGALWGVNFIHPEPQKLHISFMIFVIMRRKKKTYFDWSLNSYFETCPEDHFL